MVTFVSSWQKPRDDTEEKTLDSWWDKDELLSAAAGKDICYFFSDAFLFPWAEPETALEKSLAPRVTTSWKCVKNYLLTILNPLVCEPENHADWKTMKDFLPQNQFLYFWPLPVKYRIRLRHHCFQWIINLFDFTSTVWTKLPHGNDKARFPITAVLTWSLKSVMFSLTTTVST